MNTVVITGADRGLGLSLCREFLERDWMVLAGQFMPEWNELAALKNEYKNSLTLIPLDIGNEDSVLQALSMIKEKTKCVDFLINNAGINAMGEGDITGEMDLSKTMAAFKVNCVGTLRITQAILPLMENGKKRLCFVSSEAGSVAVCARSNVSGYCMSKTALNMAVRLMFNTLQPKGYSFRLYHPGWMRTYMSGKKNVNGKIDAEDSAKVAARQFIEESAYENRLVMLDHNDAAWPF